MALAKRVKKGEVAKKSEKQKLVWFSCTYLNLFCGPTSGAIDDSLAE